MSLWRPTRTIGATPPLNLVLGATPVTIHRMPCKRVDLKIYLLGPSCLPRRAFRGVPSTAAVAGVPSTACRHGVPLTVCPRRCVLPTHAGTSILPCGRRGRVPSSSAIPATSKMTRHATTLTPSVHLKRGKGKEGMRKFESGGIREMFPYLFKDEFGGDCAPLRRQARRGPDMARLAPVRQGRDVLWPDTVSLADAPTLALDAAMSFPVESHPREGEGQRGREWVQK